jgi:hypothetical protein
MGNLLEAGISEVVAAVKLLDELVAHPRERLDPMIIRVLGAILIPATPRMSQTLHSLLLGTS